MISYFFSIGKSSLKPSFVEEYNKCSIFPNDFHLSVQYMHLFNTSDYSGNSTHSSVLLYRYLLYTQKNNAKYIAMYCNNY